MPLSSKDHSGGVPGNASGGREVIGGKVYGTIFMGPESERETTLGKLYNAAQREQWNRQTENEYMERVRARATDRVRELRSRPAGAGKRWKPKPERGRSGLRMRRKAYAPRPSGIVNGRRKNSGRLKVPVNRLKPD